MALEDVVRGRGDRASSWGASEAFMAALHDSSSTAANVALKQGRASQSKVEATAYHMKSAAADKEYIMASNQRGEASTSCRHPNGDYSEAGGDVGGCLGAAHGIEAGNVHGGAALELALELLRILLVDLSKVPPFRYLLKDRLSFATQQGLWPPDSSGIVQTHQYAAGE